MIDKVVRLLEERVNTGDVDAIMRLFDLDAEVAIPALDVCTGADRIRELFDFCAGIGVHWDVRSVTHTDDGAACRVHQFDGWADLMGLSPLVYESFLVSLGEEDRITRIVGTWSTGTLEALGAGLEAFTPWALEHHPHLYTDTGAFRFTREAGEGFIAAAREWLRS